MCALRPAAGWAALAVASWGLTQPALADDRVTFVVTGAHADAVEDDLRAASAVLAARREDKMTAEDLFAAARGEYAPLVNSLYALGYYAPVIHVLIDGREAAAIPPLDAPTRIGTVAVSIDPGPKFTFSQARVAPVTRQDNLCVDCHGISEADEGDPTPLPPSHYTDLRHAPDRVGETVAGARWVCSSCHVPLTGADPPVGNRFTAAPRSRVRLPENRSCASAPCGPRGCRSRPRRARAGPSAPSPPSGPGPLRRGRRGGRPARAGSPRAGR